MNASRIASPTGRIAPATTAFRGCPGVIVFALICISAHMTAGRAQEFDYDAQGAEVLARGPVHEAFAGMVILDPGPGILVNIAPPDAVEELPPEERPEGENVSWIPGYWAWDDERSDFLWISGTWRDLPPGRAWMAGYWSETSQGHQWISGYWANARTRETTYLPAPPPTMESGPNIAAPSTDYEWMPGCWVWHRGRYAWRPGYWVQGRSDWVWIPANYVWTPRGFIFVDGYWDHAVEQRGVLFAPVYFARGSHAGRGRGYSPSVAINLAVFSDHLFLRPRYHHYYFGDYYAPSYSEGGIFASFSFQSRRSGHDPFYSHRRWQHRQDRDWERRSGESYRNRRDNAAERPPRTWSARRGPETAAAGRAENRVQVTASVDLLLTRKASPVRFQPVTDDERRDLARRRQDVQRSRDERRTLEARTQDRTHQGPGLAPRPVTVQPPKSPIVARQPSQLRPDRSPPPRPPKAPKPDLRARPQPVKRGEQPDVVEPRDRRERPRAEQPRANTRSGAQRDEKQLESEPPDAGKKSAPKRAKKEKKTDRKGKQSSTQEEPPAGEAAPATP